jgi:hypothetical protein
VVALGDHVFDLEDQLDARRWPTEVDALDVHTEDGPHAHLVSAQRQVRNGRPPVVGTRAAAQDRCARSCC